MDGILVSHLIASHFTTEATCNLVPKKSEQLGDSLPEMDSIDALLSLVNNSTLKEEPHAIPPITSRYQPNKKLLNHLLTTIDNNHWVITNGYLKAIANGVFPIASRSFNHSCRPSAAPTYFYEGNDIIMEVRAITAIVRGEEITVSYLDPATPFRRRRQQLQDLYMFKCCCERCQIEEAMAVASGTFDDQNVDDLEARLLRATFPVKEERPTLSYNIRIPRHSFSLNQLPGELVPLFDGHFLSDLSSRFSWSCSEEKSSRPVLLGLSLLALYFWIYPRNYPLIGLHILEIAKIAWNSFLRDADQNTIPFEFLIHLIESAKDVIQISGPREGVRLFDGLGPWDELRLLEGLVDDDVQMNR
ncbi:hypothetical protein FRC02_000926 [Tulasnella sp. 418]|nr:hypothetical protein FRC02_000926 [Tulasnella sp. 418]